MACLAAIRYDRVVICGWQLGSRRDPFERVPVVDPIPRLPPDLVAQVTVDTPHDGAWIPVEVASSPNVAPILAGGQLHQHYVETRDWGANAVARNLARELGLPCWYRVNVARAVMDFNRFPGSTAGDGDPLERFAISGPLAAVLNHAEKRHVLEAYYDAVSAEMEPAILGRLVKVAVHTYDVHNATMTRRPGVSLLSRSISYQHTSRLPFGLFDPLFPDVLAESSVGRVLRDRVALTLEKAGYHVEHNYPYCLPDGSLEIRSQPWFFFQELKHLFEADVPESVGHAGSQLVWEMLLNTNLRGADAGILSGYLHRFRAAPRGREAEFERARHAYEAICTWLAERPDLVHDYRMSPARTSALCVEVRKDLVCRYVDGVPAEPLEDNAREIARHLADGIATYLLVDRPDIVRSAVDLPALDRLGGVTG